MRATLVARPALPDPLEERADILADRAARIATHRDPVAVAQCLADASALQRSAITTAAQALRSFVAAVRAERAVIDAATRLQPTRTTSPTPFVREGVIPVALVRTWLNCAADEGHLPRCASL